MQARLPSGKPIALMGRADVLWGSHEGDWMDVYARDGCARYATHRTYLYVLKCKNDRYYVGISHDLAQRLSQHISGFGGAAYVQRHGFETFVMAWTLPNRELALDYEIILARRLK